MLLANRDRRLIAAIALYQRHRDRRGPVAWALRNLAKLRYTLWTLLSASDIHRDAVIARSVRLPHPNGIVVHQGAVIGEGCMIMQQVTIGQVAGSGAPAVGEGVYIGAGAKVLGDVTIGAGARIGANAVVLADVPAGATAVGIPARVVRRAGDRADGRAGQAEEQP